MTVSELGKEALAQVTIEARNKRKQVRAVTKQFELLESKGVVVAKSKWDIIYSSLEIDVDRSDLKAIRECFGNLKVYNKCAASDFATSKMLDVTLTPESDKCNLKFVYKFPYKGEDKHKCKVVESTSAPRTSYSLVCGQ